MSLQPGLDLPRENMQEYQLHQAVPADEALLRALTQRTAQVHGHVTQARALRLERAWVESMRAERTALAEHEKQCAEKLRTQATQVKLPGRRA